MTWLPVAVMDCFSFYSRTSARSSVKSRLAKRRANEKPALALVKNLKFKTRQGPAFYFITPVLFSLCGIHQEWHFDRWKAVYSSPVHP